ncbi:MAG TPA: hypothetical protein VMW04_03110 [Patescibacteria group bacterium]|nr:hypothetical protein [Patescibacteria group bacterium]
MSLPCCGFPEWYCQNGYCKQGSLCGQYPYPCCPNPNPSCVSGQTCMNGYCRGGTSPTSISTSTPVPTKSTATFSEESGNSGIDFGQLGKQFGKETGLKEQFLPGLSSDVGAIIFGLLPYLFVIAGLLLLFYLIAGGFQMMIAANDEKGLASAKGKITSALAGFLLLFISYWLVQILEVILGIQIF